METQTETRVEERMDPQKEVIVVTGSSGLIGAAVTRRFAGRFHVVAFDNPGPPYPPAVPHAHPEDVSLLSGDDVEGGLREVRERFGERIAAVIHLAAYYSFSGEPSPMYEELTVRGTERLLRGLKDFQVGQFVFSSTMLVHAPGEPGIWIDEDWPLDPKWEYPRSKVQTEELIRAERGDIPATMLRISGVYDDYGHTIPLAQQVQRIYERRLTGHVYPGTTAHGQAWLHLDDLVDAFELLVERREELPSELTLLLGEPEALSYDELQHTFGRLIHDEEWETHVMPQALGKTGAYFMEYVPLAERVMGEEGFIKPWMIELADDHYALDITRARTTLGWEPKRSLRETLPKMVAALKADPLGWYREHKLTPPSWLEEADAAGQGAEGTRDG